MSKNFFTEQLQKLMSEKIDSLEKTPINVAVTGESGTGKSTLVNTLRGLRSDDPASAPVGSVETTFSATPYEHPSFPNVVFWDLPGVGTPKNPQSTYKKRMDLKKYDFFLITISTRFTENTLWLAKVLHKMRKPYFFIRSKLDIDITMKRKQIPRITDQEVITELRNDIRNQTQGLEVPVEIFVLSGELENTDRWDFPLLKRRLLDVVPMVKRNTLVVSLGGYAFDLIDEKHQVLKRRIFYYATASAIGAVVPVPGLSFGVDTALMVKMVHEFAKAYGLTSSQVQRTYKKIASRANVITIIGKASALFTTKAILKIVAKEATSSVAEEVVRLVPLLGQGAAAVLSFYATYRCGKVILDKMTELAKQMSQEIIEYHAEKDTVDRFQGTPKPTPQSEKKEEKGVQIEKVEEPLQSDKDQSEAVRPVH